MFGPAWDVDLSKSVVAPLSVQYGFEASPKWHADNPGSMDVIGELLLNRFQTEIMNWLQGQRQNARNSQLQVYRTRYVLPGMTAMYTRQFGYETLRLIAQPENAGGKLPTTIPVDLGLSFNYKFHGFPIPAANFEGGFAPMWSGFLYFDDFASTPGWWTDEFNDKPLAAPGEPLSSTVNSSWGGDDPDLSSHGGWVKEAWQPIQAGSTFVNKKLSGRQYWEVKITKLPSFPVPADHTHTGTLQPRALDNSRHPTTRTTTTLEYTDDTGTLIHTYPPDLNVWRTPTIGVLTGDAIPPSGNFTPALIGGDEYLIDHPRSIGATPIAYTHYTSTTEFWTDNQWHITGPGTDTVADDAATIIAEGHGEDIVGWSNGSGIVVVGGDYFVCNGSGTGRARGPDNGSEPTPTPFPTAGGTATFAWHGRVGSGLGAPLGTYQVDYIAGSAITFVANHWDVQANRSEDRLVGDTLGYFWQEGDGSTRMTRVLKTIPPDATAGKYMPVMKGVRNNITFLRDRDGAGNLVTHDDYTAYAPTDEIPAFLRISDISNAFWTGVDLGAPAEGDVYMVATDTTDGAAYIWFGKNGFWYTREGIVSKDTLLTPSNATAALDVSATDPTKTADYYAAVSYRMGPVAGVFQGTGSTVFGPPQGFSALNLASPFTIPGPTKDATS